MSYRFLRLRHGPKPWAVLRGICGLDEEMVEEINTLTAIMLLDRLLVPLQEASLPAQRLVAVGLPTGEEAILPGQAADLTAHDRDRLLCEVYLDLFGPQVESMLRCLNCGAMFEMDFSLPDLWSRTAEIDGMDGVEREANDIFRLPSGIRFRLPRGCDELAVSRLDVFVAEQELLRRCLLNETAGVDVAELQEKMRQVAPVLDLELKAVCPECAAEQAIHFDLQSYLLAAILKERNLLFRQVHRLARTYAWSLSEIMGLPRSQRMAYVQMVENESGKV